MESSVLRQQTVYATVKYGERIDQLAARLLGKPERYTDLLAANPDLDIWYPVANQKVVVPNAR